MIKLKSKKQKKTRKKAVKEITELNLKCSKCKRKAIAFFEKKPYCRSCFKLTKPKRTYKYKEVNLR